MTRMMTPRQPSTDPRSLRVIQVIPTTKMGGLERVATTLTLALAERVARVVVCSSGGEPFEAALRADARIGFERIPRPLPRPLPALRSAVALARVLRRERPDVVHAHNPGAAVAAAAARLLARQRGIRIVTTYHGVPPAQVRRAASMLRRTSDHVVGVGPAVTQELRDAGVPDARSRTVLNAVDVSVGRSPAEVRAEFGVGDGPLIVTVGRYRPQKNLPLLIDAVALLASRGRRVRTLLVGGGDLEPILRRRCEEQGVADLVTLTGSRTDANDIAAAADVFALSSDWEGLPLALLEAMALGRPVVVTDVHGSTDLVRHEETGLLVPPRDAGALADALERLLADESLRARLGAAGRELVTGLCSPDAMASGYVAVYCPS